MTHRADPDNQSIVFAGQRMTLLPEHAVWWPQQRRLLVADVHLGKDQLFRSRGIAIPSGALQTDLQRLQALLKHYPDSILTVLGDLVHARPDRAEPWVSSFEQWLQDIGPQRLEVILGNHDRHMASMLDAWAIAHRPDQSLDGVALLHEPEPDRQFQIAGHLHPGLRLKADGQRLRLPVFWQQPGCLVLPAFGRFTGLADIQPGEHDHVFPVQAGKVFHLPARGA